MSPTLTDSDIAFLAFRGSGDIITNWERPTISETL